MLGGLVLLLALAGLSAYVLARAGRELLLARSVLSGSLAELTDAEIRAARSHLVGAGEVLDSTAADLLRLVPVARQNLAAIESVTDATVPAIDEGIELKATIDALDRGNLIERGRVDLGAVERLEGALDRQAGALAELEESLRSGRSGWLLPPLWTAFDDALARIRDVHASAEAGLAAARLAGPLLGAEGRRTYLVVLLNNAELRGAGGIPSGAGTISVRNGKLRMGPFFHTFDLRGSRPFEKVESAPDFERRFARYGADTTMWVNATFSPDVPDVAEVAANLFEVARGTATDGVILIDPRGIASLLPPGTELEPPGAATSLSSDDLPAYVMSDAYAELGGQGLRREALLELGAVAFARFVEAGIGGREGLEAAGSAVAGGHLRFVSFAEDEAAALDRLHISGRLAPPASDGVLVAAQNTGADKLDYWARRAIEHRCDIGESEALCKTSVTLTNTAPTGLTTYAAGRPYGVLENLLEVYLPNEAELLAAERDGETADVLIEGQDGYTAVGYELAIRPGDHTTVTVSYSLQLGGDGYSLVMTPQPLAFDADVAVRLSAPDGWVVRTAGGGSTGELAYEGPWSDGLRFSARPSRRTGLAGAWNALTTFWKEPVGR